jgi:4-diphosphocytidyl-2-C-methyl-D-erythritol kinase
MIVFPNAKINLGLKVLRRRCDGFHEISTAMFPIGWCDVLEVVENKGNVASKCRLQCSGIAIQGAEEDNLVVMAYQMLNADYNLPPVKVHLHKNIPFGAGLGGGSSDAAFMLKLLNKMFELGLDNTELKLYAAKLGSDCAFFIDNKPALASGRGEILHDCTCYLKGLHLQVVVPDIHISTKEAYAGIVPNEIHSALHDILSKPVTQWKGRLENDFENSIFTNHPEIQKIKEELYTMGATYAAMSGSGSAVFGLFERNPIPPIRLADYTLWEETI